MRRLLLLTAVATSVLAVTAVAPVAAAGKDERCYKHVKKYEKKSGGIFGVGDRLEYSLEMHMRWCYRKSEHRFVRRAMSCHPKLGDNWHVRRWRRTKTYTFRDHNRRSRACQFEFVYHKGPWSSDFVVQVPSGAGAGGGQTTPAVEKERWVTVGIVYGANGFRDGWYQV